MRGIGTPTRNPIELPSTASAFICCRSIDEANDLPRAEGEAEYFLLPPITGDWMKGGEQPKKGSNPSGLHIRWSLEIWWAIRGAAGRLRGRLFHELSPDRQVRYLAAGVTYRPDGKRIGMV